MRLLADENFPQSAVVALRAAGHDVYWVRSEAPGSPDPRILERAVTDQRTLITFDKDFGELAVRSKLPASCGVILFRIAARSPEFVAAIAVNAIASRTNWAGNFAVVEEHRIRLRPL